MAMPSGYDCVGMVGGEGGEGSGFAVAGVLGDGVGGLVGGVDVGAVGAYDDAFGVFAGWDRRGVAVRAPVVVLRVNSVTFPGEALFAM